MPFTLPTLVPRRPSPFLSRSPASPRSQRIPYFPPGGHTHDRHAIPPDRLHVSLSDPVLVAAEQRLSGVPNAQWRSRPLIVNSADPGETANLGPVVFHLQNGIILSKSSDVGHLVPEAVNPPPTIIDQGTSQGHCCKADFQGATAPSLDLLHDSCYISEVMSIIGAIDGSSGNADSSASENSRHGPADLAPLASEAFKEELYTRGYLKRPTSRPSNVVPRKSKTSLMFVSRKVFPKVLGRCQGRKAAECLKTGQGIAETPSKLDAHLAEKQPSTSVTLPTPHADGLESPGVDTNTSASESFDLGLHEFSYITAFTTPPSSPSIILDAEMFKGVDLGDSKHAV